MYLSTNTFSTPTALIEPFSYGIWLLIVVVLVAGCLLVAVATFCERQADQQPREISVGKSALIMLGIMNGQGTLLISRSRPQHRTLFNFWSVLFARQLILGKLERTEINLMHFKREMT